MSYPILYSATETNFNHNGIGILSACVSCEVAEEANGIFELAMTYPMDGVHFAEIGDRTIIKAKADQFREPQLFRVYAISKPMNGIVTVLAEHISYDLSGIPVKPFSADIVTLALAGLKNNAVVDCPFEFWTDKATSAKFSVPTPASIRSRLGGVAGSILDVYGGQYEFDNYTVKLHNSRGQNRGVSIRYGKNLTDIQQEQNCASVATGVYPYWAGDVDGNTVLVELPEKIVNTPGTYNFVKIRTVDFTQNFETQPTVEQLRSATENYIKNNNIGVPIVSLTVSFAQLEQSEEYKHLKLLERVSLFDTVNVEFPALGVSATAKAVKIVYDVLAVRVKSVTLGSVRANIADTIANQQQEISNVSKDKLNVSIVQKISSALAKAIMGANGGAVRLIDTNDDGEPDELYIADNSDPTQAVKVWRFNYNGWAASKNGYSGPFEFGATLEDGLLANFVTAAQLVAGTIKSQDDGKTFFLDLDNGVLNMSASSFSISGKTVDSIAQEKANTAESNAKNYANSAASAAVNAQTQADIFNKLTNNGSLKGLYMQNGELYINASYLMSGIVNASLVKAGIITSNDGSIKIDLVKNKIEVGEGTGTRPAWDSKVEVDAFGIAGYGKHYETGEFEKTLFIRPGLNYTSSGKIRNTIQGLNGIGLSILTDGGSLDLGDFSAETNIYGSIVDIRSNSGSGVEYLTPSMIANTEYRTMERFNGEPVYTKLIDFGASSGTTSNWQTNTLPHGISGISNIIRCKGCLTGSKATTLPAIIGGLVSIHADKTNAYLYRETAYTPPSDERLYIQLWYTKQGVI